MKLAQNAALLPVSGKSSTSLVLTWDENNLVLIDAGYPGHVNDIAAAIAAQGFDVKNLTHIILTHQDLDHVGCVSDLQKLAPNLKVLAHIDEAPYIDGRQLPIKLAERLANYDNLTDDQRIAADNWKKIYETNPITIAETVAEGQILPICGGIEIVHTPGHTPGHIVLYLKDSRIMVCGDAVNVKNGKLIGSNPIFTFDMAQAEASFEKIKAHGAVGFVAYHGGYIEAGA